MKFKLLENHNHIDPDALTEVHIEELEYLAVMQSVTVHVKTILVGVPKHAQIKDNWWWLTKQECVVGDYSKGEDNTGSLQQNRCYKIADAHVKAFQGKKYLSVPEKGNIQHIIEFHQRWLGVYSEHSAVQEGEAKCHQHTINQRYQNEV